MSNEKAWAVEVDPQTELWLLREWPAAAKALTLWQVNGPCIEAAKDYAKHLKANEGVLLTWANVDATYTAALKFLGELGVMVDHATEALKAHDIRQSTRDLVSQKRDTARRLAHRADPYVEELNRYRLQLLTQRGAL